MKTFVLLSVMFFLISTANAQWQKQTVETQASLRGLSVVNKNAIWAVGANGLVSRFLMRKK